MTGQELREQLARLAEDAPVAPVPSNTFRRGRRATTKSRVAGAVLAVGCVVLGAFAVGQVSPGTRPIHPAGSAPAQHAGVPDYLHIAPWLGAVQEGDNLKIGLGAAAFDDGYGDPMVIDADTGTYHWLPLPGDVGAKIALSPDGRFLAWAYWGDHIIRYPDPNQPTNLTSAGVRIVDLTTGKLVLEAPWTDPAGKGRIAKVLSLSWSANSRYVGWEGVAVDRNGRAGPKRSATYIGMVDHIDGPAADQMHDATVPPAGLDTAVNVVNDTDRDGFPTRPIAVTDDGRLISVAGNRLYGAGSAPVSFPLSADRLIGAIWLSGSTVMAAENPPRGCCLRIVELPSGQVVRGSGWRGGAGDVKQPAVVGVLPNGRVLLQQGGLSTGSVYSVPRSAAAQARGLVQVDKDLRTVTLATDLMTPGHLTVPGPTPDWPPVPPDAPRGQLDHRTVWGVSGGCAALLLAGGALWWRRRRRLTHM